MKQFILFIGKEFRHILRDRRTVLILLGMPVVQIILFGFAISTEVKNVRLAIVAPTQDRVTEHIVEHLNASEYFTVTKYLHNSHEVNEAFRKNQIDMVCFFHAQTDAKQTRRPDPILLSTDATDPNQATMRIQYAEGAISQALASQPAKVVPRITLLYNPQMRSSYNFVPGVMGVILLLICAMMTSISIVREKETGTMELLLASPLNPLLIILAKAVPYMALSFINLSTIICLSTFVLDVPTAGSVLTLVACSTLFIFVSLAIGLLVSNVCRTQVSAMLFSGMVLMMPSMILSGMIFPVESMPWPLQMVSAIIPTRWYISLVRKIMIEGLPLSYLMPELNILLAMAFILIVLSLKNFKTRLG